MNLKQSFDKAADGLRAGNQGRMTLGQIATEEWERRGITYDHAREEMQSRGVDLPSDSRLSVYKGAYNSWVVNARMNPNQLYTDPSFTDPVSGKPVPMSLTGVAIDKLYRLADEVTEENAVALLSWSYQHNDQQHRERKRSVQAGDSKEAREKRVEQAVAKNITVNPDSYDQFMHILDRIRSTQGNPNISKAQAFDFVVGQFHEDSLSDEALSFLWRQAHGEVSEEELEQVEEIDIELTD